MDEAGRTSAWSRRSGAWTRASGWSRSPARVAAAAGGGEVLVSDAVRDRLDPEQISTRRRWRFKPKGAPKGLHAYVAERQAVT
jgi:class 3 adenylate cyclase